MCFLDGDTNPTETETVNNTILLIGKDMMTNSVPDPPGSIIVSSEVLVGWKLNKNLTK